MSVCNNFIVHLGEKEQKQLRQIATGGVSIEESFDLGQAKIAVMGNSAEDVAAAALQVEAMICNAVDEFVWEEERLFPVPAKGFDFSRTALSPSDPTFLKAEKTLREIGLVTVKVDQTF